MAIENGSLMSVKKLDGKLGEKETKIIQRRTERKECTDASLHSHLLGCFFLVDAAKFFSRRCFQLMQALSFQLNML